MSADVVTLGEALVALVADEGRPLASPGAFTPFVAGAEANVAMGLARLDRSVAFVGRVGADGLGQMVRTVLRGEGVDVSCLSDDPGAPTGALARDRRSFPHTRGRLPPPRLGRLPARRRRRRRGGRDLIAGARWLHLTGITPALSASCRAAVERALAVRPRR